MFKMLPLLVLPFLSLSSSTTSTTSYFDYSTLGAAHGTLYRDSRVDFIGYDNVRYLLSDTRGLFNQSAYGISPITDDTSLYEFLTSSSYVIDPLALYYNYFNISDFHLVMDIQDSANLTFQVDYWNGAMEFTDSYTDGDFAFNNGVFNFYTGDGEQYFDWSSSYYDMDPFSGAIDFTLDYPYLSSEELVFSFDSSGNLNSGSVSVEDIDIDLFNQVLLTLFVPLDYYVMDEDMYNIVWEFMSSDTYVSDFDTLCTTNAMFFFDSLSQSTYLSNFFTYYDNTDCIGFETSLADSCTNLNVDTISSSLLSFNVGNYELTYTDNDFYNALHANSGQLRLSSFGLYMFYRFARCYSSSLTFEYFGYLHFIDVDLPTTFDDRYSIPFTIYLSLSTPVYLVNMSTEPISIIYYEVTSSGVTMSFLNSSREVVLSIADSVSTSNGNILMSGNFDKDSFYIFQYISTAGYLQLATDYDWTNLIFSYGNLPIYYLRQLLSFEILGTSLFSVLASFVTVVMVLFIIRKFL